MKRTNGDLPNYSIIIIGQNTEESPGDLGRLAVTQTPVKNYQLTQVRKLSSMYQSFGDYRTHQLQLVLPSLLSSIVEEPY